MKRTQFFLSADGKVSAEWMVTMKKSEVDALVSDVNKLRAERDALVKERNRINYYAGSLEEFCDEHALKSAAKRLDEYDAKEALGAARKEGAFP